MSSPALPSLLAGRVALVTGATRGIGRATAEILAAHGARVAVNGRSDPAAVEAFAADLAARHGTETLAVPADVADPKAVGAMVRAVGARFGRLDVLVANAGILGDGRGRYSARKPAALAVATSCCGWSPTCRIAPGAMPSLAATNG